MPIDVASPELAALCARLEPYARGVLDRCADYALALHADEVGPEHLLTALMEDEPCAARRAALHAFADPATIAEEARALSAGILISGSGASRPFSVRAVRAMRAARALAARRGDAEVELAHVALSVVLELDSDLRAALDSAGWRHDAVEALLGEAGPGPAVVESGHLFHRFGDRAKRALSAAAKTAQHEGERAISPAHVLLAALQAAPEIQRAGEVSAARARLLLRGRGADLTAPEGGPLAPDGALAALLAALAAPADTLALLAAFHSGVTPELALVLARHKLTPALVARVRGAFGDPT